MAARPRGGRQSRWGDGRSAAAGLAPWSEYDDAHNDVDEADPPAARRPQPAAPALGPRRGLAAARGPGGIPGPRPAGGGGHDLAGACGQRRRHHRPAGPAPGARGAAGRRAGTHASAQLKLARLDPRPAGSRVRVWLTRSGQVRLPPLTPGLARDRGRFAAALTLAALAGALALAALARRWGLNRRPLADSTRGR